MTHIEFISVYLGSRVDFDARYGYQCADLARAYARLVLNKPTRAFGYNGGAVNGYTNYPYSAFSRESFIRVPNTPDGVPPKGAIVIFDRTILNPYGHIGIVDHADLYKLVILEQNGGLGKGLGFGPDAIRFKEYKYTPNGPFCGKVLGWLIAR